MKKTIAVSVAVITFALSFACAQPNDQPTKVTGGGTFLDVGWDGISQPVSFTVSLNPDKKADRKSPQALIRVDGKRVQEFWGGPLVLKGDISFHLPFGDFFEVDDPKQPQAFLFVVDHPDYGEVNVWVFAHDNDTLYEADGSGPFDWFGIWIEPSNGNWSPNRGAPDDDDLFNVIGMLSNGNVMDHRK